MIDRETATETETRREAISCARQSRGAGRMPGLFAITIRRQNCAVSVDAFMASFPCNSGPNAMEAVYGDLIELF